MCKRVMTVRRLGILLSHPVQYYAPWFRHLAKRLDIEVLYAHRQTAMDQAAAGFGVQFEWDVPLLEGYPYRWLENLACHGGRRSNFNRFDTPEIDGIIRTKRFDAFLVFGWNHKSALQTIRACWRSNVPILMRGDSQLPTPRSWTKSVLKYLAYRWILPRLSAHLYVGMRNKAYLQYYGVPDDQLFFVPHCVDNEFFAGCSQRDETTRMAQEIRMKLGIARHAFVFLFVGKMIPKKRPADFIQAFAKAFDSTERSDVHAILVGDGPMRTSLERLAQVHAKRIHFAGFRNQTQLPAFYKASNALVLPSDGRETWGVVVNEAAACGIPAVVSEAVGCAPDLIEEGRTGYTYPVGDIEALTRRMSMMKETCSSAGALVKQALAEKMTRYSIEKATEGLEHALEVATGAK